MTTTRHGKCFIFKPELDNRQKIFKMNKHHSSASTASFIDSSSSYSSTSYNNDGDDYDIMYRPVRNLPFTKYIPPYDAPPYFTVNPNEYHYPYPEKIVPIPKPINAAPDTKNKKITLDPKLKPYIHYPYDIAQPLYVANPLKVYLPSFAENNYLGYRFIFGLLNSIFGQPTRSEVDTTIRFKTNVSDTTILKNSIENFNQTITEFVLKQSQQVETIITALAEFNILNVTAEEINISINNTQQIEMQNFNKLNAQVVTEFVSKQSVQLVSEILSMFENTIKSSFDISTNVQNETNLIQSILGSTASSNANMKTVIDTDTRVATAFTNERNIILKSIQENRQINEFSQIIVSKLNAILRANIIGLATNGKVNILIKNEQMIQSLQDIVSSIDIVSNVFNAIESSDTFRIDRQVRNTAENVSKQAMNNVNKAEALGNLLTSAGDGISSAAGGLGSGLSTAAGGLGSGLSTVAGGVGTGISSILQNGGIFLVIIAALGVGGFFIYNQYKKSSSSGGGGGRDASSKD